MSKKKTEREKEIKNLMEILMEDLMEILEWFRAGFEDNTPLENPNEVDNHIEKLWIELKKSPITVLEKMIEQSKTWKEMKNNE